MFYHVNIACYQRRGCKGSIRFSSNDRNSSRSRNLTRATHGLIRSGPSNLHDQIGRLQYFVEEVHAIAAQLHRDPGSIEPWSWLIWRDHGTLSRHDWWPTIVVQSWPPIGTQYRIKQLLNRAKILFKKTMYPSFFFNFWSIREDIKRISSKVLSSSWSSAS